MRTYENKEELKKEIDKYYKKYIAEFDNIPNDLKDVRCEEVDRTPAENLAYQIGWTTLILKWEKDEKAS
ncbi:MAG: ClbS/DfsB family four-helix bundle protein, partial [Clostridium perfringens]|nr:ClbS/DfsB family four-helix bundle protein [Clostridium perfringens]